MTYVSEPSPSPAPPPAPPERPHLAPRPPSLVLALLLFGVLIYIATLDYRSDEYDATYATYGLIITIAGVLGVDVSRFWRGK